MPTSRCQTTENTPIATAMHWFSAQGRLPLEVQMPMSTCFTLKITSFFFPCGACHCVYVFSAHKMYSIWHGQSVHQNSDQAVWTCKVVQISKKWFPAVPSTQFVTTGDAHIRWHPEKVTLDHPVFSMCCLSDSSWTVAQRTCFLQDHSY